MLIKKGVNCGIKNNKGKVGFELLKDKTMKNILFNYSENVKNGVDD